MKKEINLIVPEENHLERIDSFLHNVLAEDFSRSYLQKLIKNGDILVNSLIIKSNYKIKSDDSITINIPEPGQLELTAQNIPLKIIYEDESLLIINKQPGLVVHPGPGNWDNTLVNALLFHIKDLSVIGGIERPGIVHRLDKDTSGLMIIAKNDYTHRKLVDIFASHDIYKEYYAIARGKPESDHFIIDKPISRHPKYRHKMTILDQGKNAVSEVFLKKIWKTSKGLFSELKVIIHTGRTHQIRVHLASENLPIIGDPIYSKKWQKYKLAHLLLAAVKLKFKHPQTNKIMEFKIDPPEHMQKFIKKLENISINENN